LPSRYPVLPRAKIFCPGFAIGFAQPLPSFAQIGLPKLKSTV